jgi:hypothetical protein
MLSLNFDALKSNWVTDIPENHNFMISGINLGHLGADLRILGAKNASGVIYFTFLLLIWAHCQIL